MGVLNLNGFGEILIMICLIFVTNSFFWVQVVYQWYISINQYPFFQIPNIRLIGSPAGNPIRPWIHWFYSTCIYLCYIIWYTSCSIRWLHSCGFDGSGNSTVLLLHWHSFLADLFHKCIYYTASVVCKVQWYLKTTYWISGATV